MFYQGLGLAALIMAVDQASKWFAYQAYLEESRTIVVTGFFNIVLLVWNRGVSFGLFSDGSPITKYVLIGVALAISVVLVVWLRRNDQRLTAAAIGLVLGGALSNVLDRIVHGAVVDFLDFHVAGYHWPAFNVADSAIFVGVVLILIDGLFESCRKPV
ncbi:MAG: signal peptidase II [Alphaproteobacteria bacterium]|nr:signal peptidase II [Alphaproteobacteria bacterium]